MNDFLWAAGGDPQVNETLGTTAENLAEKYNIRRDEADAYAVQSQERWKAGEKSLKQSFSTAISLS